MTDTELRTRFWNAVADVLDDDDAPASVEPPDQVVSVDTTCRV